MRQGVLAGEGRGAKYIQECLWLWARLLAFRVHTEQRPWTQSCSQGPSVCRFMRSRPRRRLQSREAADKSGAVSARLTDRDAVDLGVDLLLCPCWSPPLGGHGLGRVGLARCSPVAKVAARGPPSPLKGAAPVFCAAPSSSGQAGARAA